MDVSTEPVYEFAAIEGESSNGKKAK